MEEGCKSYPILDRSALKSAKHVMALKILFIKLGVSDKGLILAYRYYLNLILIYFRTLIIIFISMMCLKVIAKY